MGCTLKYLTDRYAREIALHQETMRLFQQKDECTSFNFACMFDFHAD